MESTALQQELQPAEGVRAPPHLDDALATQKASAQALEETTKTALAAMLHLTRDLCVTWQTDKKWLSAQKC